MQDLGELAIQTIPFPCDMNPAGNIFGGWILAQIDMAASITARKLIPGRIATVSIKEVNFISPILVGDTVSFYGKILSLGNSTVKVKIEVLASRTKENYEVESFRTTDAILIFVCLDKDGKKRMISQDIKDKFQASLQANS